ncbi:hypothetical protein G5V58_20675 [Nocardioides anomalus]|uniref:Uncharacterized protein n=1 Tax=Nocardioides anomalus TaxID=2712223 RepID=A0A6G6WIA1_9ACTN|nr:hypothetical protein [Nocardioides anomalus]QIG44873.1 hypothetical protein G5V58_20675 [Nocardioides anomalus]
MARVADGARWDVDVSLALCLGWLKPRGVPVPCRLRDELSNHAALLAAADG